MEQAGVHVSCAPRLYCFCASAWESSFSTCPAMDIKEPDTPSSHIMGIPCHAQEILPYVAFLLMVKVNCPSFLKNKWNI